VFRGDRTLYFIHPSSGGAFLQLGKLSQSPLGKNNKCQTVKVLIIIIIMRERDGAASTCPYLTWIELSQEKGADGSTLPFGDGARKKLERLQKNRFALVFVDENRFYLRNFEGFGTPASFRVTRWRNVKDEMSH
jgi:hypothetical protein